MTNYELVVVHLLRMIEGEKPLAPGLAQACSVLKECRDRPTIANFIADRLQAGSILSACEQYPAITDSLVDMLDDDKLTTIEQTFMEVAHLVARIQENENVT